ncbi:hypothetical protein B0H67DRAFT_450901, partial [Lasiosphaeris hirsuta]
GNIFLQMQQKGDEKPLPYGISMFHQLHCLEMLKAALQGSTPHPSRSRLGERGGFEHEEHVSHCLKYIAQGILCAADDTIESSFAFETRPGKHVQVINGDSIVHQCRQSAFIYEAAVGSLTRPLVLQRELRDGDTVRGIL